MIKIEYSPEAQADMLRLMMFLYEVDPVYTSNLFEVIDDGVMLLGRHPNIGRQVSESGLRELVISRGKSGYVALYHFDMLIGIVIIFAVNHQREDSFN